MREIQHCNKCSKPCSDPNPDNLWVDFEGNSVLEEQGLLRVSVCGGYYSSHLEDKTKYTFSLCESCLLDLFNSFQLPVSKEIYE